MEERERLSSFIGWFDFLAMFLFLVAMCIFSFAEHDTIGTLLTAFGGIYCLNEWDKRIKKE
jgi:drug/metabolite transporter superfamily protein YnfA